jgi:putative restriction endonuclease
MAKGILLHRPDSVYDDLPEARYQFPRRYLGAMEQIKGDWIIYYEPRRGGGRMG